MAVSVTRPWAQHKSAGPYGENTAPHAGIWCWSPPFGQSTTVNFARPTSSTPQRRHASPLRITTECAAKARGSSQPYTMVGTLEFEHCSSFRKLSPAQSPIVLTIKSQPTSLLMRSRADGPSRHLNEDTLDRWGYACSSSLASASALGCPMEEHPNECRPTFRQSIGAGSTNKRLPTPACPSRRATVDPSEPQPITATVAFRSAFWRSSRPRP